MTGQYDKYRISLTKIKGPGAFLMSNDLVPGCNIDIMYNWIKQQPKPDAVHMAMESHDYDEVIINLGTDPEHPEKLGAEIEGYMGDESHLITATTALFIPRGVPHGKINWKSFSQPHIQMAIKLSGRS